MYGLDRFINTFNPAVKESWLLQRSQGGEFVKIEETINFLSKHLRHPESNNRTRGLCNRLLGEIFSNFMVPMFEKYVLVVYARDNSLDAIQSVIRNNDTNRSVGHVDPGTILYSSEQLLVVTPESCRRLLRYVKFLVVL